MNGPRPLSSDLPLKYGVPIGQTIDFQDARVTTVGAYPGQVRCKFEELNPKTREPTGRVRIKSVPRSEYDKWMKESRPGAMPKPADDVPPAPVDGRRVKIMRASPSGHPAVVWEDAQFEALQAGDVFMVVEPDGTEVPGGPWMARGPAYRNAENGGCWTVDCDELELEDVEQAAPPSGDPDLVL